MIRTGRLASMWIAILMVASACGASDRDGSDAPSPRPTTWQQLAVSASRTATTDFGRTVLLDGTVTREEYEQSVRSVVECARADGHTVSAIPRYGIYVISVDGDEGRAAYERCTAGDPTTIQTVFYGQYADPHNRGDIVNAECLMATGLLPRTYRYDPSTFFADLDQLRKSDGPAQATIDACMYDPQRHTH